MSNRVNTICEGRINGEFDPDDGLGGRDHGQGLRLRMSAAASSRSMSACPQAAVNFLKDNPIYLAIALR